MKQQTAVEFLFIQIYEKFEMKGDGRLMDEILEQAKQMEKENFVKFFVWFRDNGEKYIGMSIEEFVEQYYKETYE
jgi:hypothetical protein